MTARELYSQLLRDGFKRLPVPEEDTEQNPDPVVWFHKGRIKVILTRELIRIQQFGTEQEAEEGMPVIFSGYRTEDIASVRIKDGQFSVYIKHSWLI